MRVGPGRTAHCTHARRIAHTVGFARMALATALAATLVMHARWQHARKTALTMASVATANVHANRRGEEKTAPFPPARTNALVLVVASIWFASATQAGRVTIARNALVHLVARAMESA